MDNIPLLQKTLAEDWDKLSAVIQRHYSVDRGSSSLKDRIEIAYPNYFLSFDLFLWWFDFKAWKRDRKASRKDH